MGITKFTNCRVLQGDDLVNTDLWVSSDTGKVVDSQSVFYDEQLVPDDTLDLGGRIVAPGLIDCQLNGAFGFNFSTTLEADPLYKDKTIYVNKELIKTGVTSYLPTVTSQKPELYHKTLPFLGPSGARRDYRDGAESLGAHVEGPFLSPTKNGIHDASVFRHAGTFDDVRACYGAANFDQHNIRMITVAPEVCQMPKLLPELTQRGVVCSIGHSEATYEEAVQAVQLGATMITHLFNAMRPLHHRNPGIFGVLGNVESSRTPRPYFGVIADGIHLHPTTIKIAFDAHPDGLILVTDAMHMVGLADGRYEWTNGGATGVIVKVGSKLLLDGSDKIAGSCISLIECVNNFLAWTGATIPQALKVVTATPAAMLGLAGVKGSFVTGADADLVILSEQHVNGATQLVVDEVWKFGAPAFRREQTTTQP
ncbi:N-acetylglucosamine-6-phosphate deacetylase [Niveomyces insectorum RCEF 264]|uniref:N-acetylglucosamine-6-phosphate deacetylase n=1 Tax=Niveomyces insectorum RCEF 264 TaxID=1081102 RepID=A0A162MB35_9HYPO|nr:N-acetylglucosamine-6-phosphate deacetylase [Niveomyces insectorum RCEF 264]